MTFDLPEKSGCTSSDLRELEQSAPNTTPKAIRAALIRAAAEIEQWERRAQDSITVLEEVQRMKVSVMDTESTVFAASKRTKQVIAEVIGKLKA